MEEKFEMTLSGVNRLKAELDERKVKIRSEVAERIKAALAFGDLSENSEYKDAKEAQAENETRISEIEELLKNAEVIDDEVISTATVQVGLSVTLKDQDTDVSTTYRLVSPQEEDLAERKISSQSPVGIAIIGKKRGSVVKVATPIGEKKYKITKISKIED